MPDFDEIARRISPEELAEALGAERVGREWRCPSPSHADRDPSFSISRNGDRTVAYCHGCDLHGSPVAVAAEVLGCSQPEAAEHLAARIGLGPSADGRPGERRAVAFYDYRDEAGELLSQVVRYEPKTFRQRRPDGRGGWAWSVRGVRRVLYRLPEVLEAVEAGRTVYVVEGEKDADALAALGLDATCNPGGAGNWRPEDAEPLRGARVVVVPDTDDTGAGREHARTVAASLFGAAEEVRLLELPEGDDVSDWLDAGGTAEELVGLAEAAPPWSPDLAESEGEAPELRSRTVAEILATAGSESTPRPVVPRIAFRGKATLLAAREKLGKSTLVAAGVAAASRGRTFLSEPTPLASVLWLTTEERPADVAHRLREFGADPERVRILAPPFEDVLEELRIEVDVLRPDLVVVDTLATLVRLLPRDERPAPGDSTMWTPVLMALVDLAHQLDTAVVIIAHARKSDGEYRDSTAIGAAVDLILEMEAGRTAERKVRAKGRWTVEDFTVRFDHQAKSFELAAGTLPLQARVYDYVLHHPWCSFRDIRRDVEGRNAAIAEAREALERAGRIRNAGTLETPEWEAVPEGGQSGSDIGGVGDRFQAEVVPAENPHGTAAEPGEENLAEPGRSPRRQPLRGAAGTGPAEGTEQGSGPPSPPQEDRNVPQPDPGTYEADERAGMEGGA